MSPKTPNGLLDCIVGVVAWDLQVSAAMCAGLRHGVQDEPSRGQGKSLKSQRQS